jgi:hypothetical protein
MSHRRSRSKVLLTGSILFAGVLALLTLAAEPGYTDDTDLLRKTTAKPYVMLILDTSSSMNLRLAGPDWLPLGGDDPRSRIHASKKALYDVFKTQERVNYGFMTFNQDELRVQAKHWLYAPEQSPSWSLAYPLVPAGVGADGTDDSFTLGRQVQLEAAGTCLTPLDLDRPDERAMASRFPKLGENGAAPTSLWVEQRNRVYLLTVSAPKIALEPLGSPAMTLLLESRRVSTCQGQNDDGSTGNVVFDLDETATVTFRLVGQHLMSDAGNRLQDDGAEGAGNDIEDQAGFWNWYDAVADTTCSEGSPFTGKGLESNYDDPEFAPPLTPADFPNSLESLLTSEDEYCSGLVCEDLKYRTVLDPILTEYRELDRGDSESRDRRSAGLRRCVLPDGFRGRRGNGLSGAQAPRPATRHCRWRDPVRQGNQRLPMLVSRPESGPGRKVYGRNESDSVQRRVAAGR